MTATLPSLRAPSAALGRLRAPGTAVPVIAGLVAMLVTAVGSWVPSLWGDEAASALSAQRSLPSLLHEVTHVDAVHAVYYAGLHVWVALFGASPFALRFPSAIATGLTIAGLIVLVRLFDRGWRLALTAAVIALLLPRIDFAGVEARGYAWTAAFATWIVVIGVATLHGRLERRRGWALFALTAGAGTAVNLYVGSMIVVIGCLAAAWSGRGAPATSAQPTSALPARARPAPEQPAPARPASTQAASTQAAQLRGWAGASAAALVLAAPVIVFGALERRQVAFLAHRPMPAKTWLVSQWFASEPLAWLGWALLLLAVVVMIARREERLDRDLGLALVLWAGLPSAFLIGTIPTLHNYSPRYLTFTAPAAAVLMALGVEAIARSWRPAGLAVLAAVLLASAPKYAEYRTPYAENGSDWANVGHVVAVTARPGDQIAFDEVVRPSRRPENAYRLYPKDFAAVTVPQLVVPYRDGTTWHDGLLTIEAAAAQHRFTAGTVFAVEADFPGEGVVDGDGVPALERAGYRVVAHWRLHSDLVFELDRPGVSRS